ncbi:hypothetical protein K435DRAFT_602516, partial [Dendrothele bispora CBS 962.96]
CVTGLAFDHVAERFQHSKSTISEHFRNILDALSSPGFYNKHVCLPTVDAPVPIEISANRKWFPFFKDVLGAIDGTHINCCPSAAERQAARDRK